MCKVNGLNHKVLDVRTPCVCIRKASFRETNMPTLGAEMPKNAAGKHSSVMRNGAFGTMEKPFPHGDKASSAWRSGEDDARRQCYGVSDVAVSLYFVNVNCQNKIKLLSRCSKLIAIILCTVLELHSKVRRGSVAGYTTELWDEALNSAQDDGKDI